MNIAPKKVNIDKQTFGSSLPNADDMQALSRFANCSLNRLYDKVVDVTKENAPELIKQIGDYSYALDDSILRTAKLSLRSLLTMPLDALDFIIQKFPDSKLYNLEFLKKHREINEIQDKINAFRGIQNNGLKFIKDAMPKGAAYPTSNVCGEYCKSICSKISSRYNKLLNGQMAVDVANYDTKRERFVTRLVSGFTAALFLGNDFYNKSIQKGKSKDEAKKEQYLKQGQEIKENICEALTQFAVFSCFSKTVNSSVWATALISTGIGLASRVISRISSKMPIGRIEVPDSNGKKMLKMEDFLNSIKDGREPDFAQDTSADKNGKKPVLSARNILLFCALSIAGGYGFRALSKHTDLGKKVAQIFNDYSNKMNKGTMKEVVLDEDTYNRFSQCLFKCNNSNLLDEVSEIMKSDKNGKKSLVIGYDYVTKKLPIIGLEVRLKDWRELKTAPFRFVKELLTYPYKIATKLENGVKNTAAKSKGLAKEAEIDVNDPYHIMNLYKRFLEFESKYGKDSDNLIKEFQAYIDKMRVLSNNNITSSKGNNSKIAVIAQTLGTLTGMWFNMNDEFNASVRNGSTKEQAEKDARLRGINKFFRMSVQVIISGSLNNLFVKQYNESLLNSGLVVAASTILTDAMSRILTGMPAKKMTKEELDKYQKEHKEGIMSWYYKLIDKLAS